MSVCPFCKAQVTHSTAPCPKCGKLASEHPSIAAISGRTLSTDFDDEDHGELSLESGGRAGDAASGHGGMPYDGGKGVTLDDDLFGDAEASGPLELDVPDKPPPPKVPDLSLPLEAPPGSSRKAAAMSATPSKAPTSEPRMAAPATPPAAPAAHASSPDIGGQAPEAPPPPPPPSATDQAAVRIANYPSPPAKLWQAPKYALQVLYRRFELRQDLESLRRKRSPDVALYERALGTHDPQMYKTGLAIAGIALFLATVLFFMPVIKRFAFAPD